MARIFRQKVCIEPITHYMKVYRHVCMLRNLPGLAILHNQDVHAQAPDSGRQLGSASRSRMFPAHIDMLSRTVFARFALVNR